MSRVNFRSSVVLSALCVHECSILGEEGQFWPAATFRVTSMDRADEPLYAKSCTGCWSQVRVTHSMTFPHTQSIHQQRAPTPFPLECCRLKDKMLTAYLRPPAAEDCACYTSSSGFTQHPLLTAILEQTGNSCLQWSTPYQDETPISICSQLALKHL